MPPETPKEPTPADLAATLAAIQGQLSTMQAELFRLGVLADQAEKFLHNPIGAYKAARLGKLRDPGEPAT